MYHSKTGTDQPRDDLELHRRKGTGATTIVLITVDDCVVTLHYR